MQIKKSKPERLVFREYSIGLLGGPSSLCLEGSTLVFENCDYESGKETVERFWVSDEQWCRFLEVLNRVDAWSWERDYRPEYEVDDGGGWSLEVTLADRVLVSSGENDYPGTPSGYFGEIPVVWPDYEAVKDALNQLMEQG